MYRYWQRVTMVYSYATHVSVQFMNIKYILKSHFVNQSYVVVACVFFFFFLCGNKWFYHPKCWTFWSLSMWDCFWSAQVCTQPWVQLSSSTCVIMHNAHKHNWTRLQITKPFSALQQASNHTRVWQTSGCRFIVASPVDLDRIVLASCLLLLCAGRLIWCSQRGKVPLHNDLCWINVRAMYSVCM